MDIVDEGATVKVGPHSFRKLSPNDRKAIMASVKSARRVLLKENLKDAGISGVEYFNEVDAFDQSVFGDVEFFQFLESSEGRADIISRACEKSNSDKAAAGVILDSLIFDTSDDFTLAAMLAGVRLKAKESPFPAPDTAPDVEGEEKRPSAAGS